MSEGPSGAAGDELLRLQAEVTALRAQLQAMQTEREVLASLSRNVPGALYVLEADERGMPRVMYCSDGVRDTLGIEPEDLQGGFQAVYRHVHPDDLPAVRILAESSMRAVEPAEFEFRVILPGKGVRTVAGRATSGEQLHGRVARVGYLHDVTEERLYREAEVKAQAAEQASQAKSEFLSRMSHELRTPLNAILGFAQLLKMSTADALSAGQRQKLDIMEQAGQHLLAVISDVLDLSRIESGRLPLSLEPVSVASAFEQAAQLVGNLASQARVVVAPVGVETHGLTVLADRVRLQQVLVNLLSNGIKYNRPGGEVRLRARCQGEHVVLEVEDTGRGMTEAQMAHLFEPFNRLGAERTGVEGSGIGLVIVRRLVEVMNGTLQIDSRAGEGTRVMCALPQAIPPALGRAASSGLRGGAWGQGMDDAQGDRPTLSLLYVEDNPINVDLVTEILSLLPWCRLSVARSGLQALERVRHDRPDALLVDLQLGDMTGFDVVKALDQDPDTTGIPRVALSADAMPDTVRHAQAWGFQAYLTKPLDVAALLAAVQGLSDLVIRESGGQAPGGLTP